MASSNAAIESAELCFDQGTLLLKGVSEGSLKSVFPREPSPAKSSATKPEHSQPWVWDARAGAYRADAMHYVGVRDRLQSHLAAVITDRVPAWQELPALSTVKESTAAEAGLRLRKDQQAAIAAWLAERRGLVVMPTGTGKTEVALQIVKQVHRSTLIVAPVRDLMYQWHRRILQRTGIDAGILGDGIHRVSPVTVTTYDSAYLHMPRIGNQFALVIFDECHHLPGASRQDAARMCAAPLRLGLTATPHRSDGRHGLLEELIGPVVYRQKLEAARGETLADYDFHRIAIHLSDEERQQYDDLSKQIQQYVYERRKEDSQFTWRQLCTESLNDAAARRTLKAHHMKAAIEDRASDKLRVLEDLFRLHVGEPCLVFTGTNAMAREISRRFLIPCLLSHCGKRERMDILSGLEEGRYPALVANRVLDEGVDLPDVKVAIVIGGSASPRQAVQRLGRILRKSRYGRGVLYEVVTRHTGDVTRSRKRRTDVEA